MSVTFNLPTVLARLADGRNTLEASGVTLRAAVADVSTRFPQLAPRLTGADGAPYPFISYYLNDEDARFLGGFDAPVRDGDEVTIVSAVAGG